MDQASFMDGLYVSSTTYGEPFVMIHITFTLVGPGHFVWTLATTLQTLHPMQSIPLLGLELVT